MPFPKIYCSRNHTSISSGRRDSFGNPSHFPYRSYSTNKPAMQALLNSLAPEEAATIGHLAEIKPDKMQRVFRAIASDIDTIDAIASDIPPVKEPVTDYITEMDARCELFTKFRAMAQELEPNTWRDHANATMLAMFMVAPVHQLQIFMETCKTYPQHGFNKLLGINAAGPLAIRACTYNIFLFSFSYPD